MYQQSDRPSAQRFWTLAEEERLYQLRVIEGVGWPEIAIALNRTTKAVVHHYSQLNAVDQCSSEDWDDAMDEQIIDGYRRGRNATTISSEMGLSSAAVQGRWVELKQLKKVPEDVLMRLRRKKEVYWSEQEDEAILQAWMDGKDEMDIVQGMQFEGREKSDIRRRYKQLRREMGPIYRRLMGLGRK